MKRKVCKMIITTAVVGVSSALCGIVGYKLGFRKAFGRGCNIYKQMCEIDPMLPDKLRPIAEKVDFSQI